MLAGERRGTHALGDKRDIFVTDIFGDRLGWVLFAVYEGICSRYDFYNPNIVHASFLLFDCNRLILVDWRACAINFVYCRNVFTERRPAKAIKILAHLSSLCSFFVSRESIIIRRLMNVSIDLPGVVVVKMR